MKKKYIILIVIIIIIVIESFSWTFLKYFEYRNNWEHRTGFWKEDSVLGWYNKPLYEGIVRGFDFTAHYKSDSRGFRHSPYQSKSDASIIFIGDSFLQGCEVDNDEVFTALMQKERPEKLINAGVRGYGTDQEYLLLRRIINSDTKYVFIMFSINDLKDIINGNRDSKFPAKPVFLPDNDTLNLYFPDEDLPTQEVGHTFSEQENPSHFTYRVSEIMKNILYCSAVYRIITSSIQFTAMGKWLYEKNLMHIPDYMSYDWKLVSPDILDRAIPVWSILLDKIIEVCHDNECKPVLVIIPSTFQYQEQLVMQREQLNKLYGFNMPIDSVMKRLKSIAVRKNIEVLYPIEEFREQDAENSLTFKFDKHLNERGHVVMKNIIMEFLK